MKRVTLILALLLLTSSHAFVAGGTCPSGANYLNPATNSLGTLSSLGVTSCYYFAANGNDSNDGLNEASGHPQLHLPGMPNYTGSITPSAGVGLILRGGDTWHFGNSGAAPYSGGTWVWSWSGASWASPLYVGVDSGWYSGGSWSRPVITSDNPITTSTTLSGCSYQAGSGNVLFSDVENQYLYFDNIEMTGMCQAASGSYGQNAYIARFGTQNTIFEHIYAHGSSHKQFSCPGTMCWGASVILGSNGSRVETGVQDLYDVIDMSDSDIAGWEQIYDPAPTVAYSAFVGGDNIVTIYTHLFHDNLLETWVDPGDGVAHGNVYEEDGEQPGTNAIYNNVFEHTYKTGIVGVCFWPAPSPGTSLYAFNNVWWDTSCGGNFIDIGQNSGNQGPITFFNNTLESPTNGYIITFSTAGYVHLLNLTNNHYITDSSSPYLAPSQVTYTTEKLMTHATATSQGYTSGGAYAYEPTSGSGGTVGAGTNKISAYCGALTTAAASDPTLSDAATACQSDTKYACIYNSSNHTVSCPARTVTARPVSAAWDVGAYEYSAAPLPQPPTGVSATPF